LYRQGLQQLERVLQLEPRHLSAALSLADLYSAAGKPARSQEILQTVRQRAADFGLNPTNEFDVIRAEVNTLFATGKRDAATDALANALNRSSIPASFRAAAIDLYLRNGLAAPALPLIEQVLAENPEDLNALGQRGYACMQVNRFADARTSLDRALDLNPKSNIFRLNRAITLQHLKQFDDAQRDCEIILKEAPNTYQALFVLGEIAVEKKDTSAAARYFERCLNLVPVSSPDYKAIKARLDDLGSAKK
jgi:tetratricopeptide (TPR) repeat protein